MRAELTAGTAFIMLMASATADPEVRSIGLNAANTDDDGMAGGGVAASTLFPADLTGVHSQSNWNNVYIPTSMGGLWSVGFGPLLDDLGTATPVAGSVDSSNGNLIGDAGPGDSSSPTQTMYRCEATCHYGGIPSVTVTGVPFSKYDLIIYSWVSGGGLSGGTLTIGGTNYIKNITGPAANYDTFDDASEDGTGNYVRFAGLTNSTFTFAPAGSGERKVWCALQLIDAGMQWLGLFTSNITASSASVYATLSLAGGSNAVSTLYWGTIDGGMTNTAWQGTNSLGTVPTGVVQQAAITGLRAKKTYYYRFYGTNSVVFNETWSSAGIFMTLPPPRGTMMSVR